MRRDEVARQAQRRKAHNFWGNGNGARRTERERGRARLSWGDTLPDEPVPRPLSRGVPREDHRRPNFAYVLAPPQSRWSAPARLEHSRNAPLPYPL
jgi:hypothetical protein